jgi:hypothetical protein
LLVQADELTEKQKKRREYYLRRKDYYTEQNKQWRDANKERRKAHAAKVYKERKQVNPELFMWKQAKHRAEFDYGGMEFTITVEDIRIPDYCPYFGEKLEPLHPQWGYSLDRIDSSKGYTPDNIRIISRLANIMKNNATEEQLIAFAKGVLVVHSKEDRLC